MVAVVKAMAPAAAVVIVPEAVAEATVPAVATAADIDKLTYNRGGGRHLDSSSHRPCPPS
jgi:hypothetical protein